MPDIFKKLALHLDNLPAGFPATDTGVELRILKRLFTPEEARIAMGLTMRLESPATVAERLGRNTEELSVQLERMSKKGLLIRGGKGGRYRYMAAQFVVGIWEYHVNDLDENLIRDFNEYVPYLMKAQLTLKTQQLRVIPVSRSISAEMKIMPYEAAEEIIKSQSKILVAPCICRKEHRMMGAGCDSPLETCLIFGGSAFFYEENGIGRTVSQDEALKVLNTGMEAGLVLQPGNSIKPANICMCCGCCCQILKNLKAIDKPGRIVCSSYYAAVNAENCTACEACATRCQMDAITVAGTARVDLDKCIGCGLCVESCQSDAMHLVKKEGKDIWEPPRNVAETYINIARERGKI
ncbi:MAG: 4Fe-4S dicluster domain-containing protein [Desulfobacterales bacterium]|nr:4Fe-4S dicluster domain-containing protein [Desulfobacterales bacterium]